MTTRWKFVPIWWYNLTMTNDYLAGLVDGEGYISLIPSYRKNVDKTMLFGFLEIIC